MARALKYSTMTYKVLADNIEKPLVDDRQYKYIKLSNDLNALLIHDPQTDKSAAGLDVFVGAYKDKAFQVPGLAHFCEHLLFMGTKKYPSENEYALYLSDHGGHSNAFTSFEHTNYYFEINSDYLKGALDRFSQFFIDPLFDESCKDREINAVDSENKKNLQNDLWRFYQLDKLTSNPVHPYNSFSTGNNITLGKEPLQKGWNVRDILLEFHSQNYSSNLMNLVILGKESLDELTELATEMFSPIKNKNLPSKPQYDNQLIYSKDELMKVVRAKPIMDSNKLEVSFMIPDDQDNNWKYSPGNYYSHLLGHESKGSLYYYLNELGLISTLTCGSHKVCTGSALFEVGCELTPRGLKHYKDIIVYIFEYLKLLKDTPPQQWLVEEIRQANEINFKYRQKQNAAQTVSRLSNSMYKYDGTIPPNWMFNHASKVEFNPEAIIEFGNHLSLENMRYHISSKDFDDLTEKEKWYGTNYQFSDIDDELIERIKSCSSNKNFTFPIKNPFIPENFEIFNKSIPSSSPLKKPFLFQDDEKFQIWFKQDDQFNVPRLIVNLFLHLPKSNVDIESSVKTQLYCELLDDELNDISCYASLVGLTFSIYQWRDGISIKLNGYNDKIFILMQEILNKLKSFKPNANKFDIIKFKTAQEYKNYGYEVPYLQINTNFLTMVNEKTYLTTDKTPVLEKIDFESLVSFKEHDLFSNVFVQSSVVGNTNVSQLREYSDLLSKSLENIPRLDVPVESIHLQSYQTPETVQIDMALDDPDNVNSCIDYFVKLGSPIDYKHRSIAELIASILHEPCFNKLRTKEQLGYVVFSGTRTVRNYMGFRVLIQSERSSEYLRSRIENFLVEMDAKFTEMTKEEFEAHKQTLIDKKLIKLKNLLEESSRFWNAITDGFVDFNINEKLVDQIKNLSKEEVIGFYKEHIHPTSSQTPKYILNLKSQRSKFVALKKIIGDEEVVDIIDKHQDDIEQLVKEVTAHKKESKEYSEGLKKDINEKLQEWFPSYADKTIGFNDFKKLEMAGRPSPVEPLTNFHYTEAHL